MSDLIERLELYAPSSGEVYGPILKECASVLTEMLEALHKASDLLAVINQTPGGTWFVAADDPEKAVCDTDEAIQAAIAKAEASPAPEEGAK